MLLLSSSLAFKSTVCFCISFTYGGNYSHGHRFAYNVTFHELNQAVVKSLLESSLHDASLSKQDLSKNLKKVVFIY